jgi:hypothetical protein
MISYDKKQVVLGYMNEHMPKTLEGYKVKDALVNADGSLSLPETMAILLCQLVEENEALRATNSELAKNSYRKTYMQDCGKIYQSWERVHPYTFRTTGVNEGLYPTCNAEYGKL